MASSIAIPAASANAISVNNPFTGDGTSGNKLSLDVDGTTIDVNGGGAIEALGVVADLTMVNGKSIRPDTTTGHTFIVQGYDVDGAAYKTFVTVANSNTPTFTLSQPSGGILAYVVPTSDPHVVGALWNSTGTLTISAG